MKKLWSFILTFAFAVTLCACSSTQSENTNSSPALPEDPESAQLSENSQTEDDTDPEQLLQRLRCTFEDGSVGYIDNLTDTVTTREFVGLLPISYLMMKLMFRQPMPQVSSPIGAAAGSPPIMTPTRTQ